MLKITATTAIAAIFVGTAAIEFGSSGTAETSVPQRALKGPRLIGPTCPQAAWPNYESKCLRDTTTGQPREVKVVRIISNDGMAGKHPVVSFAN
jgi:hypothetical protein